VTANPNITLSRADVPLWCRRARAVLLGPLTLHDVDAASFVAPDGGGEGAVSGPAGSAAAVGCGRGHCRRSVSAPGVACCIQQPCVEWSRRADRLAALATAGPPPAGLLGRLLYPPSQQLIGLMAQGFQRRLDEEGEVHPLDAPSQQLLVCARGFRLGRVAWQGGG
jgi:hypothetical protein